MNTQTNAIWFSESKLIRNRTNAYAEERLNFRRGRRLADVNPHLASGPTRRTVRRILEKRVAQDYWKCALPSSASTNRGRYETRHHLSNHLRNIYGKSADVLMSRT